MGKDFFNKLCADDPTNRLTAYEALNHPWLTGIGDIVPDSPEEEKIPVASLLDLVRAAFFASVVSCKPELKKKAVPAKFRLKLDLEKSKQFAHLLS